jgi:V8-like Glu-specific endopeptidase
MPLMIAQHPDGKSLKLAVDTESVIGVNAGQTRVRYATNTEAGSSGSPVFDLDWNLVALHHLGDPAYDHPPSYNQGVPINKIRDRLAISGKIQALGGS